MTSVFLVDALAEHIKKAMAEYRYEGPSGETRTISVHKYYLKARDAYEQSITPYILVRALEGTDDIEESTVRCVIIVAVRDEDGERGYLGTVNILEHLRQSLLTKVAIGGKFPLRRPLKWTIDNEPNTPIYTGYIAADFMVPRIDSFQELKDLYI